VKHLIRSSLNEGNYYAVWDGKNEKGNETAVGYYFIRLSILTTDKNTGEEVNFVVSRKVLKLRK
jgi:flagellar hook assembly protein FlgD